MWAVPISGGRFLKGGGGEAAPVAQGVASITFYMLGSCSWSREGVGAAAHLAGGVVVLYPISLYTLVLYGLRFSQDLVSQSFV